MRNISTYSAFPPMFLNPFADVLLALYAYYSTDVVTFAGKEIKSLSTDNDIGYPVYVEIWILRRFLFYEKAIISFLVYVRTCWMFP